MCFALEIKMKRIIVLLFLCRSAFAVTYSLKYFYTGSSGVTTFPEFVSVGLVNEVEMVHYDSQTTRTEPKQDWMKKVTADNPQYWDQQTQIFMGAQQTFKANIDIVKQRFNQSGGVHVYQRMVGCEWDDQTGEVNGFWQEGYDGEDFIVFDLKTWTWVAPKQEAFITKLRWDNDKALTAQRKQYLNQICPEWGKKYVNYGRSSLLRTDLPSVSLLQKTPSSPVSCHATGFFPHRAMMFWRKDGEEIHEGVEVGEIVPNHDGSFQMSAEVDLSSVPAEDWRKYECVFQLSGVKDDVVTRLDKAEIRTNEENNTYIYVIVAVVVVALVLIAGLGVFIYKKKNAKRPPSPMNSSDGVMEQLNPPPTA